MTKKKRASDADKGPQDERVPVDLDAEQVETPAGGVEQSVEQPQDIQAERDDLLARLQRVSADYMNYQKRVQREREDALSLAHGELIKALLPMLDDMERALEAARENHGEDDALFKGMQLVHDKALEVLERFGCTVIQAEDKPFDPDKHLAIMQQPSDEYEPQTVIREVQRGYSFKGRTLRPSGVIVAVAPADDAGGDQAENGGNQ